MTAERLHVQSFVLSSSLQKGVESPSWYSRQSLEPVASAEEKSPEPKWAPSPFEGEGVTQVHSWTGSAASCSEMWGPEQDGTAVLSGCRCAGPVRISASPPLLRRQKQRGEGTIAWDGRAAHPRKGQKEKPKDMKRPRVPEATLERPLAEEEAKT